MIAEAALENTLGRVLTVGTRVSTTMLGLGLLGTFIAPSAKVTNLLLNLGLIVLLLTPVARVAVSVVGFIRRREWWFVLYTGLVLMVLIASFIAAFEV